MTPEQYANPPAETDAFLASEQDVLEDALSYAVSTLVLTKARGRHGPDAVLDLAERLQEYARYISSGGGTKKLPRLEAVAPPEPPVVPPQKEKTDPKKDEETPEVEPMEWSAFKWLHGNHSVDRAIITTLMKDFKPPAATADKSKGDAEMAFCQALCDGGEKRIQEMLTKGKVIDQLAEKIHAAAKRLKEGGSKEGSTGGQKFSSSGDGATLSFGKLATFYSGLEAFIGPPKLHIVEAMKYEHCMGKDAKTPLVAQNYNTHTTSKIEFLFVTAPTNESLQELGIEMWPADQRLTRSQKEGAEAELNEDTLRGAMPREATHIDEFRPVLNLRNEKLRQLDQPPLRDEEFYAARLYTGPMYLKYNAALRHKGMMNSDATAESKEYSEKQFQELCVGNYYVSTLHAINSSVVKLGKLAKAQKVYRGISNRALSQDLREPNEYNVRGGVEFAFMSTTPKREVAMEYAGKGADSQTSIVFEIKMGMIDRGADISWLSQYPHEEERLFPPLTALSIEDDVVVEDDISMFKVRLNVNLLAMTLEQMDGKMHRSHISMIDLLTDDLKFAGIPSKLVAPLRYLKNRVENRDPADFTDVDEFQQATTEALDVQQGIFDELCTGATLESEIRKEEQFEEQERKRRGSKEALKPAASRQESQGSVKKLTTVVEERCKKASINTARVAAGAGSKGQRPAVIMLQKSFKGHKRGHEVTDLLQKHTVAKREEWVLDALWLLVNKFRADPPWPGVIVEIMKGLEVKTAAAILAAFTELLAGWVKIKFKEVQDEAVSKQMQVFVYDKDNRGQPWTRARLTGESKPKEGSANVTLVEASRGNLETALWVEKDKHVVYPGYDGAGALLFEAVKSEQMPLIKAILDANVSVFSFDRDGSTAILKAAKGGKLEACKMLTERGADAHLFNKNRQNAFDAATLGRHTDCLRLLQPTDADKQAKDPTANKLTPLMEACHKGDLQQVEQLLGTSDPDAESEPPDKMVKDKPQPQPKLTALVFAANQGYDTIVTKLLERKPQEAHLLSALMLAARSGNEALARLLLAHSPELAMIPDEKNNLALHKAAQYGHDKVLNLLLQHDADAKAANLFETTPLMMATRFGHSSTTANLLRAGADKNRGDDTGWTPLMRAAANGHTKVVVELLKGSGDALDVNAQDKSETTALMAACKSGQLDTASLLLDHGADALLPDSKGLTALHHSASAGHDLVVKALLQQPDEVVQQLAGMTNQKHMTPLMLACQNGCEGAVRLLLSSKKACAGAPVAKGREGDGYTALMIAVEQGHEEVVRVILQQTKSDVHQAADDGETTVFSLAKKNDTVLKLLHQVRTVLFQCHQQTEIAYDVWHRWLRGREPESLKVSLPPFNVPKTITLLPITKSYNVPTFGVMIPKAIMPLFESEEIKAMAEELHIKIPQYALDSFVQKKMFKVKVLVQAARDLGGWDEQADRLERFATAFENLPVGEISGPDEWKRFVEQHVAEGWESRLHFDHVLQNFGFDDDVSKTLRAMKHAETDGKTSEVTTHDLETFSFRWLGKAFSGYSVKGCLTDVVNLVFAMAELYDDDGKDPKDLPESEIADKITAVVTKVNAGDLSGLWVPTHIVHDSESDDLLCWLLLEQIHKTLGSDLQVLVQFPPSGAADLHAYVQKMSATRKNVTYFRDRDSKNEKAVRNAIGLQLPK